MRYIAFLRGINVGGHQVKMDRLRAIFGELGHANVGAYIQSGNIFFDAPETDRAALTVAAEERLRAALGFAVPVCLRSVEEVERTLAQDPFRGEAITDDMRLNVVFAARPVPQDLALPAWSPKRDMEIRAVTAMDAFVIWYLRDGRPPSSMKFLEQTLGSAVTSRFLHTTAKILAAAKAG
ncbi:MAG TPA: DUF1697 domain-containing protein [Ktedonobacterales bacterium]